jgi:hypothetical protein
MPFGATQQEIQFSPFRAWLKGIINNSDFHNRTYHISYFLNKLEFTGNTIKLEPYHLDLPNSSYTFSKLHSKSRKNKKKRRTLRTLTGSACATHGLLTRVTHSACVAQSTGAARSASPAHARDWPRGPMWQREGNRGGGAMAEVHHRWWLWRGWGYRCVCLGCVI